MKTVLAMIGALLLSASAVAQQLDNPATVPITYHGRGNLTAASGSFSFGAGLGNETSAFGTGFGTQLYSTPQTAYIIPGKEYSVNGMQSGLGMLEMYFTGFDGCEVYINGVLRHNVVAFTPTFTFKLRVEKINDLTGGLAGKRGGECSSFAEDKPIWYVGLGTLRSGQFAGGVGFRSDALTSNLWSPSALVYDTVDSAEVTVTRDSQNGYISSVLSRDVFIKVDSSSPYPNSYRLLVCRPETPTTPFITYTIRDYVVSGGAGLRIDKEENGILWSTLLQKVGSVWTLYDWQKVSSGSSSLATGNPVTTTVSGTTSTVDYGSGAGMVRKQKTYTTVNFRSELASVTWGPGVTSAPTTTYAYYTTNGGVGWTGALQSVTLPNGGWSRFEYFGDYTNAKFGQIQRIFRPWQDSPAAAASATTTNCLVETYDYVASYDGTYSAPSLKEVRINNSLMGKTTWTYNWTFATVNAQTVAQKVQQEYPSATVALTTTQLSFRPDNPNTFYRGRLHALTRPDGTKDAYAYHFGTWDGSTNTFTPGAGNDRRILVFHGQAAAGTGTTPLSSWESWTVETLHVVPNLSTVSEAIIDTNGREVFAAENVLTGVSSMERISAHALTFNANNLKTLDKDVLRSLPSADVGEGFAYTAGQLTSKTAIDGTQTVYHYDDYLRNDSVTTSSGGTGSYPARNQSYTFYSSNRKYTSQECDCSPTVTTYTYEMTGRVASASEPKPGGGLLTTVFTYPSLSTTTETAPNNVTKTTAVYLDGRIKSRSGTGQVSTQTSYSYDGTSFITTVQNGPSLANGWVETKTDWLGRVAIERTPQVSWLPGSTKVVRQSRTYSASTGQLNSVGVADEGTAGSPRLLPDHLYVYGTLGRLVKEGDDVDGDGSLTDASTDRITMYGTSFWKDGGGYNGWIKDETVKVFRSLNSSADITTASTTRTRLTRFNNGNPINGTERVIADQVTIDASGRTKATWVWINPAARTKTQYVSLAGVSQAAYTVWQDGYLKSEQSSGGVVTTRAYNSQGLLASVTESTTNAATSYAYHPGTKYVSSSTTTTGPSSSATTSYTYTWDASAQSMTVAATDAAANVAYTEYNGLGLPWRTWGTAAQPMLIGYDAYGRRTNLTTWRSGTFSGAVWPSPSGGDVVSWTLDPATGAVNTKTYPNGSGVGFTYNARGQMRTRTWARTPAVTTTYDYYDVGVSPFTGELKRKTYNDGTPSVSFTYTRFGSLASVTDMDGASTRSLTYRSDLQLDQEVESAFYGSKILTATYDGSVAGRLTGFSFNGLSTVAQTVGFDPATGRANSVSGSVGSATAAFTLSYASGTDWVNSVTSGSYSRSTPLVGRRDVLSSATTTWAGTELGNFVATYSDSRGWRNGENSGSSTGTSAGSWSKLLGLGDGLQRSVTYNGYGELATAPAPSWRGAAGTESLAGRSFGWNYDLAGNRNSETGAAATTYVPDSLNRYTSITGTLGESTLTYDADGNLTQDGTWLYAYDAENQLKSMTRSGQSLAFTYDYLGRRVRKTVTGTAASDTKYLWAGWKLLAELSADGVTPNKSFVWGRDFSDAQGAAGGAGSLLAQIAGSTVTYSMPDAFGNSVGYVNASGTLVAAAEYTPYGRTLKTYGAIGSYPIGYSGQYTDQETGLVYYGLRYYSPKHGRFINRDPIEEDGGANLYRIAGNATPRGWDVLGLTILKTIKCNRGVYFDSPNALRIPGSRYVEDFLTCWETYVYVPDDVFSSTGGAGGTSAAGGGGGGGTGVSGTSNQSTSVAPNKPPKSRCDELAKKYGNALNAESGGFFDNQDDARRAMIINIALGARTGEGWEYASHVIDMNKLTSSLGTTNGSGQFFVSPAFSNWMAGLPMSRPGNGGNVDVTADAWFSIARGGRGVVTRPDGRPGSGYPNSAVLDTGHSHPPGGGGAEVFSGWGGDMTFYHDNAPVTGYLVTPSGRVRNSNSSGKYDSSLIPQADLQDIKGCFGDGRL